MRTHRRKTIVCLVVLMVLWVKFFANLSPANAYAPDPIDRECQQPRNTRQEESRPAGAAPCSPVKPQRQAAQFYTVQYGDTLAKIARQYDTSISVLLLANPAITNADRIYIDQKIRIPNPAEIDQLKSQAEKRAEEKQQQIAQSVDHHGLRWIDVDLGSQKLRAYSGDTLEKTFLVSTGTNNYPTVTGSFNIWIKLRYDDMRGPGYDLKDVPYVLYFYKGYGLHGTYWHHNFGTPMSHGCVNLSVEDAAWLYDFAEVGTLVNVH